MPVDTGLGRRLQLIQGLHWLYAANGDPYAALLRGFDDDLGPVHDQLRQRGPLWFSAVEAWVTARHDVARDLLADPAFGPRAGTERPAVQQIADWAEALDGVPPDALPEPGTGTEAYTAAADRLGPEFDVVPDLADRVPAGVVAAALGLGGTDAERFAAAGRDAAIAVDALLCPQRLDPTARLLAALTELRELSAGHPAGLLLATFGTRLAADLVSRSVHATLTAEGEWARLAAAPERAAALVTEVLRHDPPVQVHAGVARTGLRHAGQDIPAGSQLAVVLGAANRDPEVFADACRFDPDRPAGPVLLPPGAAGLVLPLARAHAEAALRALAARFPTLRGTGPALRRNRAPVTRGLLSLPVGSN